MPSAEPDVSLLLEFGLEEVPTGLARRAAHLRDHLEQHGLRVAVSSLSTGSRATVGVRQRISTARNAPRLLEDVPRSQPVVVVGLGTPTMLIAARALAARGRPVVFDHCDGVLLQLRERLRLRDPRLVAIGLWLLALHLVTSPRIALSYISPRDADADRSVDRGRTVVVARPTAPTELAALAPVGTTIERVVVPIELGSLHARRGFDLLLEALRQKPAPMPIELFGPTAPTEPLPDGVRYAGWAEHLADVYAGSTAVLVTNIGGSGVPNKLVEAAAAGRPLVLHPSLLGRWPLEGPVLLYRDAEDLGRALDELGAGRFGTPPPGQRSDNRQHRSLGRLLSTRLERAGGHDDR